MSSPLLDCRENIGNNKGATTNSGRVDSSNILYAKPYSARRDTGRSNPIITQSILLNTAAKNTTPACGIHSASRRLYFLFPGLTNLNLKKRVKRNNVTNNSAKSPAIKHNNTIETVRCPEIAKQASNMPFIMFEVTIMYVRRLNCSLPVTTCLKGDEKNSISFAAPSIIKKG